MEAALVEDVDDALLLWYASIALCRCSWCSDLVVEELPEAEELAEAEEELSVELDWLAVSQLGAVSCAELDVVSLADAKSVRNEVRSFTRPASSVAALDVEDDDEVEEELAVDALVVDDADAIDWRSDSMFDRSASNVLSTLLALDEEDDEVEFSAPGAPGGAPAGGGPGGGPPIPPGPPLPPGPPPPPKAPPLLNWLSRASN